MVVAADRLEGGWPPFSGFGFGSFEVDLVELELGFFHGLLSAVLIALRSILVASMVAESLDIGSRFQCRRMRIGPRSYWELAELDIPLYHRRGSSFLADAPCTEPLCREYSALHPV